MNKLEFYQKALIEMAKVIYSKEDVNADELADEANTLALALSCKVVDFGDKFFEDDEKLSYLNK